uniref:hypothetical protein n=1 Tax=Membranihabitans maritimus TaxID=2904244 RepID=UPI001F30F5B8
TMTINGGEDYDFKIEDPDNPSASISGYIELEPHWGSDDLEFFSGTGPHLVEDYNFECPAPTDGTCEAAANIRQLSGTATSYTVVVLIGSSFHALLTGFTGNPSQYKYYDIDETESYTFVSQADNGGSEDYSLRIVRPDATALSYYYYDRAPEEQSQTPAISSFDCPY